MDAKATITQEELKELQDQQNRYNQILFELGAITVAEITLNKELSKLKEEQKFLLSDLDTLKNQSEIYQKELIKKYGEIDIDLTTGEFKTL